MENLYLFDEKEIYLQEILPERTFTAISELQPHNAFSILIENGILLLGSLDHYMKIVVR